LKPETGHTATFVNPNTGWKGIFTRWRLWQGILKGSVFIFTVVYLYQVWHGQNITLALHALTTELQSGQNLLLLSITFFLIFVNWGIQAWKWRLLVKPFSPVSFGNACKAVLAGTSVSLWVPNRAGEYLGRVFFIKPAQRVHGILATLIGSTAQLLATIIAGAAGLVYYIYHHSPNPFLGRALIVIIVASIVLLLVLYFNINKVRGLLPHWPILKYFRKQFIVYRKFHAKELGLILFWSLLRYGVFCSQFVILLTVFHSGVSAISAMFTIFLIYLVQSVLPGNSLTELGTRGASGIWFFSVYTSNVVAVSAATYSLWLINVILPAIVGLVFFMGAKWGKGKENHVITMI